MVNGSGSIFVPVDTSVFMRPILTRDEVEAVTLENGKKFFGIA